MLLVLPISALVFPLTPFSRTDCGSFFLNGGGPVTSGCTMPCAGNPSELCGGAARLNVYNNTAIALVTPTYEAWESIGCYTFVSNDSFPELI